MCLNYFYLDIHININIVLEMVKNLIWETNVHSIWLLSCTESKFRSGYVKCYPYKKKAKSIVFVHILCRENVLFVRFISLFLLECLIFPCWQFCLPLVQQSDANNSEKNETKEELISAKPPVSKLLFLCKSSSIVTAVKFSVSVIDL